MVTDDADVRGVSELVEAEGGCFRVFIEHVVDVGWVNIIAIDFMEANIGDIDIIRRGGDREVDRSWC